MPEESTTPDLVELTRRAYEATSRHDIDALMRFYAPNTVWDGSNVGIGTFEGVAAIRSFVEEWWGTWGEHTIEVEEIVDLDHGVVLSSLREDARLVGSDGHVEQQRAAVVVWVKGIIERQTPYLDIDEARAAAERLAQERGQAMLGENVEIVRRWIDAYNQRDYDRCTDLLAPDVVFDASHRGFGVFEGRALVCKVGEAWVRTFDEFEMDLREVSDLGRGVVFTVQFTRGRPPGTTAYVEGWEAYVVVLEGGVILRYTNYSDIDEGRAAAERLAEERG